jgi:hypothetical protein
MLAKSVAKANRVVIRWAIRRRSGVAYLAAIFWFPTLTAAGLTWALVSIHEKPSDLWPVVTVGLVFAKKFLAIVWYLIQQYERIIKALRHYRRHFRIRPDQR